MKEEKMIMIKARSLTTGSEKEFLLTEQQYKNRHKNYPGWAFMPLTKKIVKSEK